MQNLKNVLKWSFSNFGPKIAKKDQNWYFQRAVNNSKSHCPYSFFFTKYIPIMVLHVLY